MKKGKITAIGPTSIETSITDFDFGSIVSPVIHKRTGTCIGVISYVIEETRSKGNLKRYQMVNLEDEVVNGSGRYFIMRFDVPIKWYPVTFDQLEKINLVMIESSLSVEYIKEYVIRDCFRNDRGGFMCNIDESPFRYVEGVEELKNIIRNHNAKIAEIRAKCRGSFIGTRSSRLSSSYGGVDEYVWTPAARLIWQTLAEETIKDLKKYLYQSDANLSNTKANIIMSFDAKPLSLELRRVQDDLGSILNGFQRQKN